MTHTDDPLVAQLLKTALSRIAKGALDGTNAMAAEWVLADLDAARALVESICDSSALAGEQMPVETATTTEEENRS